MLQRPAGNYGRDKVTGDKWKGDGRLCKTVAGSTSMREMR